MKKVPYWLKRPGPLVDAFLYLLLYTELPDKLLSSNKKKE